MTDGDGERGLRIVPIDNGEPGDFMGAFRVGPIEEERPDYAAAAEAWADTHPNDFTEDEDRWASTALSFAAGVAWERARVKP